MSYINTFIKVSDDCPIDKSQIPVTKNDKKTAHLVQYELLSKFPYKFDHMELVVETYIAHKEISQDQHEEIRQMLCSKGQPCLRASALTKRYGFGAHYNEKGKIAIYPMESDQYKQFLNSEDIKVIPAMRNKK